MFIIYLVITDIEQNIHIWTNKNWYKPKRFLSVTILLIPIWCTNSFKSIIANVKPHF